jgi:hypothetical protein
LRVKLSELRKIIKEMSGKYLELSLAVKDLLKATDDEDWDKSREIVQRISALIDLLSSNQRSWAEKDADFYGR